MAEPSDKVEADTASGDQQSPTSEGPASEASSATASPAIQAKTKGEWTVFEHLIIQVGKYKY